MFSNKTIECDVANYYDNNSSRFLGTEKKRHAGAIHRRLHPPAAADETDSVHYSNSLVLGFIRDIGAERILDLGCGIGGSIRYLRSRYKAKYTGISLSPVQCAIAREFGTEIELGSYLDPLWYKNREPFDLIYAIESLQHNPDHNLLVRNLKKVMKQDSRLVVIDDFIKEDKPFSRRETKLINRFKNHWHSHGFTSKSDFIETLNRNGLVLHEEINLTSLMPRPVLNRHLRAAILNCLSMLPVQHSALDNIIGGGTLLLLQQLGLAEYYLLVLDNR